MSVPTKDDSFVFVNIEGDSKEGSSTSYNITQMEVELHPPEMKSMHVVSKVQNRYARTEVTSKYINPDKDAQEATFSIVLPNTAFIAGFVMEIKGKKYEAHVKEKEEAKEEYQQAVSSGRAAAHVAVSARDSNKFTVSVNVEPQSDVTFILTYEELLIRKHSKYEMIVNLHPGQLVDDLGIDIHINEIRPVINVETPAIRSGNEITDQIAKNTYATIKKNTEGIVHVSFHPTIEQQKEIANGLSNTSSNNGMSGQFVVEYDVQRDPLGGEVLINDGYFVHFFAPTELKPIPKHVVFVLDVSGSMQGRKIEQLKEAMKIILGELNPDDYFNIIKFENDVQILYNNTSDVLHSAARHRLYHGIGHILYNNNSFQEAANTSLPATAENIKKAQNVVGSMQAGGGTNISDALITALSLTLKGITIPDENYKIQPIIVFLTDGQANVGESNPDRIIESVLKRNDSENKSAIFTLAFGNDANKEFLKELAMKNSGFLRNIYEAADASLQLQDFYKQISSPLLTNVNFKYSEEVIEVTKHKFDILFNGSEFVVTGKVGTDVDGFVVVEGSTLYGIDDFRPTIIPIKEEKEKFGNLERLWAYMTIKQLLDKKYEKKNHDEDITNLEAPEKQALTLALKYSFVTPVTSLVVVKPEETTDNDLQWGSVHVASSNYLSSQLKYHTRYFHRQMQQQQSRKNKQSNRILKSKEIPQFFANIWDTSDVQQQQEMEPKDLCLQNQQYSDYIIDDESPMIYEVLSLSGSSSSDFDAEDATVKQLYSQSPKLKSLHLDSSVRNRYARTMVTSKYVNRETRMLQATFCIVLPDTAFITALVMEIKGKKYAAKVQEKNQAKKEYQEAVAQGLAAAHISHSADNPIKFTMSINIESQSEVTFILTYEQPLVQKNSKYEIVTNLHPGHLLEDLEVDVKINDAKPIGNVETSILRSRNQIINNKHATINKNKDGSIHVSFKPTVEQQKEIINILKESDENNGISGQFVVEYKIENSEDTQDLIKDVPVAAPVTDLVVFKSD